MSVQPPDVATEQRCNDCRIAACVLPRVKKIGKETLISMESTIRDKWAIKALIGSGGYGEIYLAIDKNSKEEIAVKVEPQERCAKVARRMILEAQVLRELQGRPHAPRLLASGKDTRINWIAMQLLSINVSELKKQSPLQRLSRSTTARIVLQAVAALREVHGIGYVHRDVKPANMCFGITKKTRHIVMLLDFGLVRRYKYADGTLRPERKVAGFRGTLRYISLRVHRKLEQCPADDLMALAYSGIELMAGELPWKYHLRIAAIANNKRLLHLSDCASVFDYIGPRFQEFTRAISTLGPGDEPNYSALQSLILEMSEGKALSDPYDWEDGYVNVGKHGWWCGGEVREMERERVVAAVCGQ